MHLKFNPSRCKWTKIDVLSYQSFIYIFRNFKKYQSEENGRLKKQFKSINWNGRIRRDFFKDKNLFSSHIVLYKWWLNMGKCFSLYKYQMWSYELWGKVNSDLTAYWLNLLIKLTWRIGVILKFIYLLIELRTGCSNYLYRQISKAFVMGGRS